MRRPASATEGVMWPRVHIFSSSFSLKKTRKERCLGRALVTGCETAQGRWPSGRRTAQSRPAALGSWLRLLFPFPAQSPAHPWARPPAWDSR